MGMVEAINKNIVMQCIFETPALLWYTHIPVLVFSSLAIFFLFSVDARSWMTRYLATTFIIFSLWLLDLVAQWVIHDVAMNLFVSRISILGFLAMPFFLLFAMSFLGRTPGMKRTLLLLTPFFFGCLFIFSNLNIQINPEDCNTQTGILYYYFSFLSFVYITRSVWILVRARKQSRDQNVRKQIVLIVVAMIFSVCWFALFPFLIDFTVSAGLGDELSQIMPAGILIFIGMLTYAMLRHRLFDVKIAATNVFTIVIWILVGSQLLFVQNLTSKILIFATFILVVFFGIALMRSVREEMRRKEELQRISDSLAKANERLRELDNTKTEFISIASHQLRTPLTAIKGYLSLLLEGSYGALPAEITDVLEKLNLVNRNLIQLVEDLLNVSRIDAGRIKYSFEPTQLETLVAERVDMFMPIARDRGIELGVRPPREALPKMMIDPGKMREAISNLVDNSIKYTEKGSVIVSIEPVRDEAVRILVEDTGIGFREEDGAKLFGKFVRTQETTKVYVSGTGLGLFVGKSFVEAHGGRMWAESDGLGKGARFYIELPVVNPKAPMENGSGKEEEK
jgi:signal transduction histidine kinase